MESRSWRDRNLKFGPNCDLGVDNLETNTPPSAKLGLCRRTIYSKLSTSDHNLFQIFLRESKFFFEHQISVTANYCRGIKRKVVLFFFQIVHLQIAIWAKFKIPISPAPTFH